MIIVLMPVCQFGDEAWRGCLMIVAKDHVVSAGCIQQLPATDCMRLKEVLQQKHCSSAAKLSWKRRMSHNPHKVAEASVIVVVL